MKKDAKRLSFTSFIAGMALSIMGTSGANAGLVDSFPNPPLVSPSGLTFSTDGKKLFVVSISTDDVRQFECSAAFVISSCAQAYVSFSPVGPGIERLAKPPSNFTVTDVEFSRNGKKMFVLFADPEDEIVQYSCAEGFNILTCENTGIVLPVAAQDTGPRGLQFSKEGKRLFVAGNAGDKVFKYVLTTRFDLSTATFSNISFSVSGNPAITGMAFSRQGWRMYITDNSTPDEVKVYCLSMPLDISTAVFLHNIPTGIDTSRGVAISNDGQKMFVANPKEGKINEYDISLTDPCP